jgi:hypothetical protein
MRVGLTADVEAERSVNTDPSRLADVSQYVTLAPAATC